MTLISQIHVLRNLRIILALTVWRNQSGPSQAFVTRLNDAARYRR
jgi:hypothetical protein